MFNKANVEKLDKMLFDNFNLLKKGKLPKSYEYLTRDSFLYSIDCLRWRDKYIKEFGFPLFSEDWVKPLSQWIGDRPCLEIMAGTGYLSYALSLYGVNIKATDDFSWKTHFTTFRNVENIDCLEAIKKYGKDVKFIICSWPYMDETAYNSLLLMREINPKCRMIYIGEGYGGCTASDTFFNTVEECEVEGFYKSVMGFRSWPIIHDRIYLYK